LSRRFKDKKFEKTKLALSSRKSFMFFRPGEAAWGSGNRNPGTFGSFGYKRTYASSHPGKLFALLQLKNKFSTKYLLAKGLIPNGRTHFKSS